MSSTENRTNRLNMDMIKHEYEILFYNKLNTKVFSSKIIGTAEEVELEVARVVLFTTTSSDSNNWVNQYHVHYSQEIKK